MRSTMLRLALLGTIASLPALAQTTTSPSATPPATGAARGNESRTDTVRPATPNQGAAAGQGVTTIPDARTGATTPSGRSTEGGQNAVQLDEGSRMGSLEPGANSFTEGQARSRMEAAGFTNLEGLRKDDNGIWRGRAMRSGQQVDVGLDYRGNVAPITR